MDSRILILLLGLLVLSLTAGCATNNARYTGEGGGPVNSWSGFWNILLPVLTFVVGFIGGAMMVRGDGVQLRHHHHRRRTEAGWHRISQHISDGTQRGLAEWRSAGQTSEPDWDDLGRRIEENITAELRKHHD